MNFVFRLLILLGACWSGEVVAQSSSRHLLSPDLRLSAFTATSILPGSYFAMGGVDVNNYLNFTAGSLLVGNPSENVKDLVKSRLYLGADADVSVNLVSLVWKPRKGGRASFGANLTTFANATFDRDLLQIATEGILSSGFGSELIKSKGVSVNAHVYNEVYYHKVRQSGKTNFGYRVRLINPMYGAQFATSQFELNRTNDVNQNSISLNYDFRFATYGFNPQDLSTLIPTSSDVTSANASLMFDLGIEQEMNSKLKLGINVKNIPGFVRIRDADVTKISGQVSFSGVDYNLGTDSVSKLFDELLAFNLDSILPNFTNFQSDLRVPFRPVVRLYGHRYISEETYMSLAASIEPAPSNANIWTSFYVYSRPNKLFHLSYGLNWWTNNNVVSPSIAGRMLLAPFTRLTLSMSNPFLIPRITPSGAVLIPSNFNGMNIGLAVSFGRYRDESF